MDPCRTAVMVPTGPGKSWNLLIFMKNPGKVLEFYTVFV